MKITELDTIINQSLMKEAKKLIKEQIGETDHLIDSVKSFQSLSKLVGKITDIENTGTNHPVVFINIQNIKPEELVDCCGGTSLEEAQRNLMQGLHHDLENNGFGNSSDVDVETSGDENALNLAIRITPGQNSLSQDKTEMSENTKDTNPTVDDKKDVILGGKEVCPNCEKEPCECSNEVMETEVAEVKKWIQKAVDPKHKGYCTPMTKKTCTPARKALAKRFKKGIEKNESTMKKTITLNEAEMAEFLRNIITEAAEVKMDATTQQAIRDSGTENNEALKAVQKKIKDYLSFKGNDNPEFPHQVGMGDEKEARVATTDEDEFIDDNRGRGPQDLDYQNEPSKGFKDRLKMSLVGDSKMGNPSDAANAIKTDVGEKMHKKIENRQKIHKKEPIYAKEPVPVDTTPEKKEILRPVNEEIQRMKQMSSYNEKTQ